MTDKQKADRPKPDQPKLDVSAAKAELEERVKEIQGKIERLEDAKHVTHEMLQMEFNV